MSKILCVLYEDPVDGYPKSYPHADLPKLEHYPDGQKMPTPKAIDFKPGVLLGSVSGELGLRRFLESQGHEFVVTTDKDGPNSVFERELPGADVVISQPFWPAYLTAERIAKAKNLKLAITAGIGSDHVDLQAAMDRGVTVAEVTYCNSISVSEHIVMQILALVRNYIPSYQWVVKGGWNIADCVARSYDLEGMHVGTVGAGRIGLAALRRLKPFDVKLHYTERHRLPEKVEQELGLTYHSELISMLEVCDVITINTPLHVETEHLFDEAMIAKMKRGAYLINTARGKICDENAVAAALRTGQLAGYAGDVWFPQPPPKDHPWRSMPNHGMTPHIVRHIATSTGALRRRCSRDSRVLVRQEAYSPGISHCREWEARRHRRALLQRGRYDARLRKGGAIQAGVIARGRAWANRDILSRAVP